MKQSYRDILDEKNIGSLQICLDETLPKGTILVEFGKILQRGVPKLGKYGKPMKDKTGKIIYEPYRIKVPNTINFKKSMHYNLLPTSTRKRTS